MLQAGSLCSPECRAECATADTSTCCDSLGLMKAFLRAEKVKEERGAGVYCMSAFKMAARYAVQGGGGGQPRPRRVLDLSDLLVQTYGQIFRPEVELHEPV